MITVKQLIDYLHDYQPDVEVILSDGREIKHVGMTEPQGKAGGYSVVLAPEVPVRQCAQCGGNVFNETSVGLANHYPYYCPTCQENKYCFETLENTSGDPSNP